MADVPIQFAESALRDFEEMRIWYAEQGVPEIAERFINEIFLRVEALSKHPDMGRIVPEFGQKGLRELIHPPFRLVYRCEVELVSIVRVWRSERLLRVDDT